MTLLSREAIIKASDIPTETVHVPEWKGDVIIRGMTLAARDAIARRDQETRVSNAVLLAHCMVDGNGTPFFTPDEADTLLGQKHPEVVDRLTLVALRLSGLERQATAIAEKNSDGEASGSSSSSSPKS